MTHADARTAPGVCVLDYLRARMPHTLRARVTYPA